MILSRDQLNGAFAAANVPPHVWISSQSLNGDNFATVSREWVDRVWGAGMEALWLNAPELVEMRQVGGGKTVAVPRYKLAGFNCRGHSLFVYAHGMMGLAVRAAQTSSPLAYDALAWGFMHYTAEPRPDNLNRAGRHQQLWFVDHAGVFQSYEPGDGEENEMTPTEIASITFLYAQ